MATITSFSAEVISADKQIRAISGRIGNFIFKSYKNGKIIAYFAPKNDSKTSHYRENIESISSQLREITYPLRLEITNLNFKTA